MLLLASGRQVIRPEKPNRERERETPALDSLHSDIAEINQTLGAMAEALGAVQRLLAPNGRLLDDRRGANIR